MATCRFYQGTYTLYSFAFLSTVVLVEKIERALSQCSMTHTKDNSMNKATPKELCNIIYMFDKYCFQPLHCFCCALRMHHFIRKKLKV